MSDSRQGRLLAFSTRERIKTLREFNRLTVRETAKHIGVSKTTIVRWGPRGIRGDKDNIATLVQNDSRLP